MCTVCQQGRPIFARPSVVGVQCSRGLTAVPPAQSVGAHPLRDHRSPVPLPSLAEGCGANNPYSRTPLFAPSTHVAGAPVSVLARALKATPSLLTQGHRDVRARIHTPAFASLSGLVSRCRLQYTGNVTVAPLTGEAALSATTGSVLGPLSASARWANVHRGSTHAVHPSTSEGRNASAHPRLGRFCVQGR
jgi:hypothetical protein